MNKLSLEHAVKEGEKRGFKCLSKIYVNSKEYLDWECPKCKETFPAILNNIKNGSGCPYCIGLKAGKSNCLFTVRPDIAEQWHPTKNGEFTPKDFTIGSNQEVWWKCEKGHAWPAVIYTRTLGGNGCPYCSGHKVSVENSLASMRPDLAKQWHPTKNDNLTPSDVTSGSNKIVWWQCLKFDDHEWDATVASRTRGGKHISKCPFCSGHRVASSNCLAKIDPKLAKEWHPTKNDNLTPYDVTPGSNRKVWWRCLKFDDHEWDSKVNDRKIRRNCPFCTGKRVAKSNSLASMRPDLAKQWHPTKNDNLTPYDVTPGSKRKVWWFCSKFDDHEWDATPNNRSTKSNCPYCSGNKVSKQNSLATIFPDIAMEWHPTANGDLTPNDVTYGSKIKIWWQCKNYKDHVWKSTVNSRTSQDSSCEICTRGQTSKQEIKLREEITKIYKDTYPKGYSVCVENNKYKVDIFIPTLNLIIEWDSYNYHKELINIEADSKKSEQLRREYKLIRVRQEPLKKIHSDDIVVQKRFNTKKYVEKIVRKINYIC